MLTSIDCGKDGQRHKIHKARLRHYVGIRVGGSGEVTDLIQNEVQPDGLRSGTR